jgi:hypothetical protein
VQEDRKTMTWFGLLGDEQQTKVILFMKYIKNITFCLVLIGKCYISRLVVCLHIFLGIDTSDVVEYYTDGKWSKKNPKYPYPVDGSFGTAISDSHILICGGIIQAPGLFGIPGAKNAISSYAK